MGQARRPKKEDPEAVAMWLNNKANEDGPSDRQLAALDLISAHGGMSLEDISSACYFTPGSNPSRMKAAALRGLRHLERLGMVEKHSDDKWVSTESGQQAAEAWAKSFE